MGGELADHVALEDGAEDLHGDRFSRDGFPLLAVPTRATVAIGDRHALIQPGTDNRAKAVRSAPLVICLCRGVRHWISRMLGLTDDVSLAGMVFLVPTGVGFHEGEDSVHRLQREETLLPGGCKDLAHFFQQFHGENMGATGDDVEFLMLAGSGIHCQHCLTRPCEAFVQASVDGEGFPALEDGLSTAFTEDALQIVSEEAVPIVDDKVQFHGGIGVGPTGIDFPAELVRDKSFLVGKLEQLDS